MDSSVAKLIRPQRVDRPTSPRDKIRSLSEVAAVTEQCRRGGQTVVEAHGGRIHFTDEVTFSSSELINRHVNVFEPHIREHLDTLRQNGGLDELCGLIESVANYRVLIVGDAIIDEYQYVLPMHKTPK